MKGLKSIITILALILVDLVHADEDTSKGLYLEVGSNNSDTSPEFFIPLRWSNNSYSGFGFRSTNTRIKESNSLPPSLYSTNENNYYITEDRFLINVYAYEIRSTNSVLSYGIDYESIDRVEEEYGYLEPISQPYISFKNINMLEINKLSLNIQFEDNIGDWLHYRVGYAYSPSPVIKYTHDIYYIATNFNEANYSNNFEQSAAQQFNLDIELNISAMFDLSFNINYEILPVSFSYNNFNGSGFDLTEITYENKTNRFAINIIYKKPIFGTIRPTIGLRNVNIYKDQIKISDNNYIIFGIENRF